MTDKNLSATQADLRHAVQALMALRSEIVRVGADMSGSAGRQVQALQQEALDFRQDVGEIIHHAGSAISKEAEASFAAVTGKYREAAADLTAQARKVNRMVWGWFAVTSVVLVLAVSACWMLLGHYRKELADAKEQLARHKHALEVVQAFHASDAVVCGGRICIQPDAPMAGNRLYRQAKLRETAAAAKAK